MEQEESTEHQLGEGSSETTAVREWWRWKTGIACRDQSMAALKNHSLVNDGGSASDNESDVPNGEGDAPLFSLPSHRTSRRDKPPSTRIGTLGLFDNRKHR